MLLAHLVPAYFAVVKSQPYWKPEWTRRQRIALWVAALGSTVVPDLDVVYNALFRGFFGHTILWTHSLFPYAGIALIWWVMRRDGRWFYLQTMIGLVLIGGVSHLVLDVVAHSTPLLYPISMYMFGAPSLQVAKGGLLNYVTDPVLLLEPFLIALAVGHWISHRSKATPRWKRIALLSLAIGLVLFDVAFLVLLPTLQRSIATQTTG